MQPERLTLCMWCQWALSWNWGGGYLRVVTSPSWWTVHLVEADRLYTVCNRVQLDHPLRPVADYQLLSA